MERFCGDILPNIKSRRYPYKSIDHYVSARAHLSQIKLLYNLHQELSFQSHSLCSNHFALPWCKCNSSLARSLLNLLLDQGYILAPPKKTSILPHALWVKFTAVLGTRFEVPAATIRKALPKELQITEYGRVRQLDGGDTIQACELVAPGADSRDMTFIRVSTYLYTFHDAYQFFFPFFSTSFSLTSMLMPRKEGQYLNREISSGSFFVSLLSTYQSHYKDCKERIGLKHQMRKMPTCNKLSGFMRSFGQLKS
jgi:hypothetical protein